MRILQLIAHKMLNPEINESSFITAVFNEDWEKAKAFADTRNKEVYEEFRIPLRKPKKKRKHHHVDILIVEDDSVLAINSKGKSFNNTKSEDSELDEYNWYKESLSKNFPGKEVNYIVFKDEYDENDSKMNTYHYLNENGISVYNTEEYMVKNYNIDFDALEKRRQDECVRLAEEELISDGFTLEQIYAACPKIETIN
jgi:hypothetical protein